MVSLLIFFISLLFLTRTVLIFTGHLKGPVIALFQKYGDKEDLYLPLLPLLAWSGMFLIGFGSWSAASLGVAASFTGIGIALLLAAFVGYQYIPALSDFHRKYLRYPRWYHRLLEHTTRYERRRIAYMWLRLPWRMRLTYNSDDRWFVLWADFVIMGTVMESDSIDQPGRRQA
ncbi:MAG: hypothetical protein H6671_14845 [Anaerolineaceae bacterium]|nr:hypothetical protein [Anaerolineaceae bacterium]